ncbi:MAG: GDSL-type esterase/lipase family protein [Faecalibacterium sp.]|jgi:lysophospholipase L1-like esterase|nr:GDSL-type esterase/lipase family protein [Faecalibacterium sp.]
MSNKKGFWEDMTPKQRQAAIVCAVCALAVVLTASITGVLVSKKIKAVKGVDESSIAAQDGYDSSAYVVTAGALLPETDDAGDDYVKDTLFIGDSNTVRMYNNGLITLQQFCAEEGLGIQDAATKKIVAFKGDSQQYAIPDAVAMMKPRRVVITLGTNNCDGTMSKDDFINDYKTLVQAIQEKYKYTDIIVNAVPPIPASHANYPNADQGTIDQYNMALADMCDELNVKFLNSAEALKDENGYGNSSYYVENDIHFTMNGLKAVLKYYRAHAYTTDDQRPDTSNIPTRTQSFTSGTSGTANNKATATPTATAGKYKASYYVDSSGGGTLSCGNDTGKTKLEYDVTDDNNSFTVKAVPNDGSFFIKWSDGVKTAERTDKDFKQNVNVTAVFGTLTLTIEEDNGLTTATAGAGLNYTVKLSSDKYASSDSVIWYANDTQVETGTHGTFHLDTPGDYSIYAAITVNGVTIKSKPAAMKITAAPTPTPAPTAAPTPAVSINVGGNAGDQTITAGQYVNFAASISNCSTYSIVWLVNGQSSGTSASLNQQFDTAGTYPVVAQITVNGTTYSSNTINVTVS